MELVIDGGEAASDLFFDVDDFTQTDGEEIPAMSVSLHPVKGGNKPESEATTVTVRGISPGTSLRRRRSSIRAAKPRNLLDSNHPSCESDANSEVCTFEERRSEVTQESHANSEICTFKDGAVSNGGDSPNSTFTTDQTVTGMHRDQEASSRRDEPSASSHEYPAQNLLVSFADLVIEVILFQVHMLMKCLTLPIWFSHNALLFVFDPLGTIRRAGDGVKERMLWVCKVILGFLSPLLSQMLGSQHDFSKLAGRIAWGCFWSFYVGSVLFGLLMTSFFGASLLMSRIVEEPLHMIRDLNFDYTSTSPHALVPLMPCDRAGCSLVSDAKVVFGRRYIPPNQKVKLTISLTLPESDYNRNLGVFQVRAELLSINGKVTSVLSQPCMLKFKSSHIRLMESFLKTGPLLAGYSSESQVLDLKMSTFSEEAEPTMSIRIVLEHRAEYRPGAGIPEIYSAVLKLESELPALKKLIWSWRKTLLVWIAMGFFIWEMLFVLLCCKPVLIPGSRPSDPVDASFDTMVAGES
ncbi:hypothetical protein HPP92_025851 [Vanilla planifolia]|uniref:Seipin n=1 Tax=Vanilla planifolia TaxID=51239 RepID=A0A835U9B1_VANPL|nr:hypothetical protein HPP92_025851 [Vanilla planifolia]